MRILEVKTGGRPVQMAPIALGAQPMGSTMPEETAFACLDAFCQWGESRGAPVCVDTARVYSSWIPGGDGTSERTIGRWLSRSGNREKVRGLEIIFSSGAIRAATKALRDGRGVGTLIDQNTRVRDGGSFVNFFGLPVSSSTAPAQHRAPETPVRSTVTA